MNQIGQTTEITLKGVQGKVLAEYVKLTAAFDINMQLYFTQDSIRCFKQHSSESCSKFWQLRYEDVLDNGDEIKQHVIEAGQDIKLAMTDLGKFIKSGLFVYKEPLDIKFSYNTDGYAIGKLHMHNASGLKIKHSIADGYHAFHADLTWEVVNSLFTKDDSLVSFTIEKEQLKRIKQLSTMDTIAGKLIEYVQFHTEEGKLCTSTLATDWAFKDTDIELAPKKIQSAYLKTLLDGDYEVYIKKFGEQEIMVFDGLDGMTQKQATIVLSEFNTTVELTDIEDAIGNVSFEDFAESNSLF